MANEHAIDVVVRADTTALSRGLAAAQGALAGARSGFAGFGAAIERNRGDMETVGKGAAIMGGAILAGIGLAIHAYSEFSSRMAQVQSLSHASSGEMDILTKSALSMGTAFGLSANDVADAEIELVKAGVSVKEMMGGALPGALALAAAGQIDVGKATEIATIALTQFNLKGKDVPHVADLLAAGADKALGGVQELGDGLKQGGLVASQFGLTIDDTVGTLSAFANAGLLGSDAGTSMKTMFLALASPSTEAQKALDKYNITAYDSQGKFKGVADLAGQLKDKLGPLSDAQRNAALSTIFGTDAMRSASVLMKEGSTGIQKWIKDVNEQGFASVQAAGKMDSLNGDFKKLQASFETGLIKMGSAADGFLRPVVKGLADAVTAFSNMDPAVQGSVMGMAAMTGGALLLVGGLLTVIPKIHDTVKAAQTLAENFPRIASAMGKIGIAAGIAGVALIAFQLVMAAGFEAHTKSAEEYGQAILAISRAVDTAGKSEGFKSVFGNYATQFGVAISNIDNLSDAVHRLTNQDDSDRLTKNFQPLTDFLHIPKGEIAALEERLNGLGDAMGNLVSAGGAETAAKSFQALTKEFEKNGQGAKEALEYVPGYKNALMALGNQYGVVLEGQDLLDLAMGKIPDKLKAAQSSTEGQAKSAQLAAQATADQQKALDALGIAADGTILHLDKLVQSMQASGLISISADQAAINYQKSLEAVDAMVAKNGQTLDIHTKAGKENMEAWLGQASSANAATLANAKNGMSAEELQGNLTSQYNQLRDNAIAFGAGATEADNMARKALGIPKDVPVDVAIKNYADTMAKAQAIKDGIDRIPTHKEIDILVSQRTQHGTDQLNAAQNGGATGGRVSDLMGFAGGGKVPGQAPSDLSRDNILATVNGKPFGLQSEEWVINGPQSKANDKWLRAINDGLNLDNMFGAYAGQSKAMSGGVRPSYAAPAPSIAWAPVAAQQAGGGGVHVENLNVSQVDDPIGTSHAVVRRLSALAT